MYLSSIPVETGNDPTRIWPGKRWIRNPYRVHQRLSMAFDGNGEKRVLFRIEGPITTRSGSRPRILVQSRTQPDWPAAFGNAPILVVGPDIRVKPYEPDFPRGQRLRFRLRANPAVKKKREGSKHNPRVGIMSPEGKLEWFARKAEQAGFIAEDLTVLPEGLQFSRRSKQFIELPPGRDGTPRSEVKSPPKMVHLSALFEGVLRVTDEEAFAKALAAGIGPAKAYGFGLLSVAPL